MSKYTYPSCDSVDLTEDEDSRDSTVETEINHPRYNFQLNEKTFRNETLPPLIPIPRVNSPIKGVNKNVPTLTKIKSKIDSSESEIHNQFLTSNTTLPEIPQSATSTKVSTTGKLVLIKKNNKLYKIVIPHNVMPSTCDAGGPVVINIPEVGPLVIKIDPQVKAESTTRIKSSLEPFSLNFDEIIEKNSTTETLNLDSKKAVTTQKAKVSVEKLFPCWNNLTAKNKRKYGVTSGFSKRDCINSNKCLNTLNLFVYNKKRQLEKMLKYYQPPSKPKKARIHKTPGNHNQQRNLDGLKPINISVSDGKLENVSEPKTNLSKEKTPTSNKIATFDIRIPIVRIERFNSNLIRSCYVKLRRSIEIEKKIMCGTVPVDNQKPIANIDKLQMFKNILAYRTYIFNLLVIESTKTFQKQFCFTKPLLVVNAQTFHNINFETEYSKANLVYSVGKNKQYPELILKSSEFNRAVTKSFIKLIDSDILCSYLKGELGPY